MKTYEELLSDIEDDMELMGHCTLFMPWKKTVFSPVMIISRKSLIHLCDLERPSGKNSSANAL